MRPCSFLERAISGTSSVSLSACSCKVENICRSSAREKCRSTYLCRSVFFCKKWWVAEKICLVPKDEQWVSCFLLFSLLQPPTTCCLYGISDPCKYKNNLISLLVSLLLTLLHTFYHETKKKSQLVGTWLETSVCSKSFRQQTYSANSSPLPVMTVMTLLAGRHYCLERNTRRLHPHCLIVRLMTQQEHNRWHSWFFFIKQTKSELSWQEGIKVLLCCIDCFCPPLKGFLAAEPAELPLNVRAAGASEWISLNLLSQFAFKENITMPFLPFCHGYKKKALKFFQRWVLEKKDIPWQTLIRPSCLCYSQVFSQSMWTRRPL